MRSVSVLVPTLNEEASVYPLVLRLNAAMVKAGLAYEAIFIDDHSTDQTRSILEKLSKEYPVYICAKQGKPGKAFSLLEGFAKARYAVVAMIDADLQYKPEAIPHMVAMLSKNADIVVGKRIDVTSPVIRRITSFGFQYAFGRLLHGLSCDVQSGLKVFKREIVNRLELHPSAWTFDLEFLVKAKQAGYTIAEYEVPFAKRLSGETKVKLLQTIIEIGWHAVKTRLKTPSAIPFDTQRIQKEGFGFHYKSNPYITHNELEFEKSALVLLTGKQKIVLLTLAVFLSLSFLLNWKLLLIFLLSAVTIFYFVDLFFNLVLIVKSLSKNGEITVDQKEILKRNEHVWPTYTILCPLYKEWRVLPQFIGAMKRIDYPQDKLQVLLLLEEDDKESIAKIAEMHLPCSFSILVVPDAKPKTKPKACNYGLQFAKGEYTVIFDAEDVPDVDQLKKAVLAFEKSDNTVVCMQAKLNYYNPKQNVLTCVFTAEYALWFDLVLVGLQALRLPIPLGGTSNHFKTVELKKLNGWDAFNVTEDCDIGMRLVKAGLQTAIINSTTLEEANSRLKNWLNQRTRWIKGYMQTYIIHMRDPFTLIKERGIASFLAFQIIVGGRIASLFINPIMWGITFAYFAFRSFTATFIESLFPTPILYIGVVSLVFGNFLYLYYYMIGCAKKKYYDIIAFAYLVPLYWLAASVAGCNALQQLILRPHYWSKTVHGFHLSAQAVPNQPAKKKARMQAMRPSYMPVWLRLTLSKGR